MTSPTPGPLDDQDYLEVPWSRQPDYRCFGCSPHNPTGLRLRFTEHEGGLRTRISLGRAHESYPGVVHGGLISTVCDEIMGNLVVLRLGTPAFTVAMRIRYLTPLSVDGSYDCVARLRDGTADGDLVHVVSEVLGPDGEPHASASASYRCVPMDQARRHLRLDEQQAADLTARLHRHRTEG